MKNALIILFSMGLLAGCSTQVKKTDKVDAKAEIAKSEADLKDQSKADDKVGLDSYSCLVLKDKRLVELDKKEGRCEVHYTKFGEKSQVAWAESTPSICLDVFAKIKSNIESKGFKCELPLAKNEEKRDTASTKK